MKEKNKKALIFCLLFLLSVGFITIGYLYYKDITTIHFYINNEKVETHSITLEYEDHLKITPETIGLTAIQNKKDISEYIKVSNHKFRELKTYDVDFYIEENDLALLRCQVKIVDSTPPTITGDSEIEMTEGETFDESELNLHAEDIYDGDITDKIKCESNIDTSKPGEYSLLYVVEDSSKNRSEKIVFIKVKEKPAPVLPSSSITASIVNNPNDITVLLNKNYKLPDGWAPGDLALIEGRHYLRNEAASSANQMLNAARSQGITIYIVSSYRSQNYQYNLYHSYMASDPMNAPYYSAPPRSSEHELGLAIDVSYDSQLHSDLQLSNLGAWMAAHAHEYGWILRYPYDKTHITGYMYEPWHYRYVGVDLATYLKNNNVTLEEYFQ